MSAIKHKNLPDQGTQVSNQRLEQLLQLQRDILEMVAEGVETPEQHRFLCRNDCDHLQGFLYARPTPAEEITQLLTNDQLRITTTCNKR